MSIHNSTLHISISIDLTNHLKSNIKKLQKIIKKKTKIKKFFESNPNLHINILSGIVNKKTYLKIKSRKFLKLDSKKILKINGTGIFLGKKSTFFIRYKLNNFLYEIRNKIIKMYNNNFLKIDATADKELWFPKTTYINEEINSNKFEDLVKIVNYFKFKKKIYNCRKLVILKIDKNSEKKKHYIKLM